MRKIIIFFLLVATLLIITGCGNKKPPVAPSELYGVSLGN